MKKSLLLALAIGSSLCVAGQAPKKNFAETPFPKHNWMDKESDVTLGYGSKTLTGIQLGNAANIYTSLFGAGAYVWADPASNSILFTHRADPAVTPAAVNSGGIVIDFSTDGGTTWSVNTGPVHIPNQTNRFDGRYPQGVVFNPTGNTVGSNAYAALMFPTLSATNGAVWGGTGLVTAKLNPSSLGTVSEEIQSGSVSPSFKVFRPTDLTFIPSAQKVLGVSAYRDLVDTVSSYRDSVWVASGTWDATNQKVAYTWNKFHLPVGFDSVENRAIKLSDYIAAENNTVWISTLGYNNTTVECVGPILLKSTDGGATFGNAINVNLNTLTCPQVGGGTLLSYLQNTYSAWTIGDLSTAFDHDLVVDKNGNPHLMVNISPAGVSTIPPGGANFGSRFSIFSAINFMVDITTTDGGTTWKAHLIDSATTFRGTYDPTDPPIVEDNRPHISRNLAGDVIFASYFETNIDLFGTENLFPDLHMGAIDVDADSVIGKFNMTSGNDFEGAAMVGNVSHFAFDNGDGTYTIPSVITNLAGGDPAAFLSPVSFTYLPIQFPPSQIGLEEAANFGVSQSYPNPATTKAYIDINANDAANFSISVVNMLGQVVYAKDLGRLQAGSTRVEIPTAQLGGGMYLYTITDGQGSVTNRMVVR
jgi:hypothetical protein